MKSPLSLLLALLLTMPSVHGDSLTAIAYMNQKAVQDPKTKVIFYLESDLRHITARSLNSKLLWVCEVISPNPQQRNHILSFGLHGDTGVIDVSSYNGGYEWGIIDKKTGIYTFRGRD